MRYDVQTNRVSSLQSRVLCWRRRGVELKSEDAIVPLRFVYLVLRVERPDVAFAEHHRAVAAY